MPGVSRDVGTFVDLQWEDSQGRLSWTRVWWYLLKVCLCKLLEVTDRFSSVAVVMVSQVREYIPRHPDAHVKCAQLLWLSPRRGRGVLHRRMQWICSQGHLP